ncbi:helix-turn-helix domain-containing protein [Leucobacter aridicollis]|uniref:Excisionase family DNA binding protein n=1 Tax=Leucobacter aridicollis TaxID=283878 RepID=A0A852R2P2_9MICO|nr:helix-turn-helix domain-containing protein [Leucobacter aridicollis]MBL3682026.1 DNA-binding protein [Leucobacter aridicollis]NYD26927.1 excisionase family DNA binding protein [Leucobacter aridicollis]
MLKKVTELPRAWYSLDDVADILGLERTAIYEKSRKGSIPATKIGGRWMIPVWYVNKLLEAGTTPPEPAAA